MNNTREVIEAGKKHVPEEKQLLYSEAKQIIEISEGRYETVQNAYLYGYEKALRNRSAIEK